MNAAINNQHTESLSYESFGRSESNTHSHFFWWCAGVHQNLLKEYPSEHSKYAGLGGVLIGTFVLASISAGYALETVFGNWIWAWMFGIIWGLIIFNFDRFMVTSMRKYGVSTRKQVMMAIPRVILALLISFTIARPLELKIFEKEINVKISENRHHQQMFNDSLVNLETSRTLLDAQAAKKLMTHERSSIEDSLAALQRAYLQEADGTGGSMLRGIKDLTMLKKEAYQDYLEHYTPEMQRLTLQIRSKDSTINQITAGNETKKVQFTQINNETKGFLEKNKALADLSSQEISVFWAILFISLLIIMIETAPILSKLIMTVGPYDVALAKEELLQMATSENQMRHEKSLLDDKLDGIYQKKREISDDLLTKVSAIQQRQIDNQLQRWERGERYHNNSVAMDDLLKNIRNQFNFREESIL
ncbi:MAG TPA: DUF4407 domain-containing protein [Puia sp.]|nr:DUF4407 domain-containing protein [Puia sp.]